MMQSWLQKPGIYFVPGLQSHEELIQAVLLGDLLYGIDGRCQFVQDAVMDVINPAVDSKFLAACPGILHNIAARNIVYLLYYIEFA